MRDDLTQGQIDALHKLGWRAPAERRALERGARWKSAGKVIAVLIGSALFLKACQLTQGYHVDDDDGICNRRGECQ
jgi:hypothetical protein